MPVSKLKKINIKLKLPFLDIGTDWELDTIQEKAAWEMYVELITRISVVELQPEDGLLREALTSLHSLFKTTREILKSAGPFVATPQGKSDTTFGHLAVAILNKVIRPLLAKWHPILTHYENERPEHISPTKHERNWKHNAELRKKLNDVRLMMMDYAGVLALASGVAPIHEDYR